MSSPETRVGEAEKQLRIAGEDFEDDYRGELATALADLVELFAEGVGDE